MMTFVRVLPPAQYDEVIRRVAAKSGSGAQHERMPEMDKMPMPEMDSRSGMQRMQMRSDQEGR